MMTDAVRPVARVHQVEDANLLALP